MKVVCVGDCGIDHYLPSGDLRIGGISANFARRARDQFHPEDDIVLVSCLGEDEHADRVREAFSSTRIECLFTSSPGVTPVQHIEVQPDGERRFTGYEAGVLPEFRLSADQLSAIHSSDLLVMPVYVQIVDLFERLLSAGAPGLVAVDFADFLEHPDFRLLEAHLDAISVGFFGLTTSGKTEIERIARIAAASGKLLIVTLGSEGSVAFHGARVFECAAESAAAVVDTTGAGDAYAAGFLSRYCHGASVTESMRHAARVAAAAVSHPGGY